MQTVRQELYEKVRKVVPATFEKTALEVFRFQAANNPVYKEFLDLLSIDPVDIRSVQQIPFLPIGLFKSHQIKTGFWEPEQEFTSSGTTGMQPSRHFLRSKAWYQENAVRCFEHFYGPVKDYVFLALLPHYLDRSGSSLVAMVQHFMEVSDRPENGFFLRDLDALSERLKEIRGSKQATILIGVSFALWDLAERSPMDLKDVIIMETGGMKGQRRELIREELHQILKDAFQVPAIHSEYGMTELLSQAYSKGEGRFLPAPGLQIQVADISDPFSQVTPGSSGQIRIVDLANIDSCSFVATEDIGRAFSDGSFEVLGRLDRATWRGCNLMLVDGPS